MQTATINLRKLHAVSLVAATDPTRYYLSGVLIEVSRRETIYVATDGHSLVAAIDARAGTPDNSLIGEWIVPADVCRAFKFKKPGDEFAVLAADDIRPISRLTLGDRIFAPIDGTFPDWRRVLPSGGEDASYKALVARNAAKKAEFVHPAHFNFDKLAVFNKVARILNDSRRNDVAVAHVIHGDPNGPAAIHLGGEGDAFGILMPMRQANTHWTRPAWSIDRQVRIDGERAATVDARKAA